MPIAKRLLLLLPLFALLSSCSEDFKVDAPYKPITVVYGLMNTSDTAHYVRVQKAFLDENISALVMAKTADSSFYNSITVHLKELNGGSVIADEALQRVDLNNEGYKKDTGVFFSDYNYAYKTKRVLNPGYTYRLVVTNTATGEIDSAETAIISNAPGVFLVYDFNSSFRLNFPATNDKSVFTLTIKPPPIAQIFEGIIRFHYVDKTAAGIQTDRTADWSFATGSKTGASVILSTNQRSFYSFLRDAMGPAPANVTRYMDSADIFVWAGSNEMSIYQQINGAQGGLTADQIKPLYTNIKSTTAGAALGLFTTRAVVSYYNVPIDELSLDSLKMSAVTQSLNIQGRSDH